MCGLLGAEEVGCDDFHAAFRCWRVVDFVGVGLVCGVGGLCELVMVFGEVGDFCPVVGFCQFVCALVGLPSADDV